MEIFVPIFLLVLAEVDASRRDNLLKYEEYIIEHEISSSQAKNAALSLDFASFVKPAGCQTCTKTEIQYCLSGDLINDHCCCDKRYLEAFPFIPHTCYLGEQLCKPVASDCAEYSRLRECCCDNYVLLKWKSRARSSGVVIINSKIVMLLSVFMFVLLS